MSNATYAHWINQTAFLTATALGSPWLAALWLERKGLLHKPDRLVNGLFQVLALRFVLPMLPYIYRINCTFDPPYSQSYMDK